MLNRFLFTMVFFSLGLCAFAEGKSASVLAGEIYGKDSIELTAKYKASGSGETVEYAFVKSKAEVFLVVKTITWDGKDYEESLCSAVKEVTKEEVRETLTELNVKPVGDDKLKVFYARLAGMIPFYVFLTNGRYFVTDCPMIRISGGYYQRPDEDPNVAPLVDQWNQYKSDLEDKKNDELLKSYGL